MKISYFITPHGFGHAARACAVMEALLQRHPGMEFHLFTKTPAWFFEKSVPSHVYHELQCDLGLVQRCPMVEDLHATATKLNDIYPVREDLLAELAQKAAGSAMVICDVAVMGVAVAKMLGVPSVLIENFTWDWIYCGYADRPDGLDAHILYINELVKQVDVHIQTEPVCNQVDCTLSTAPVSRKPRTSRAEMRRKLGIPAGHKFALISMGGVKGTFPFLEDLKRFGSVCFAIPGSRDELKRDGNLLLMAQNSGFFHPDLIGAADVVVCKAGYSTIAEAYNAGIPMAYMLRDQFPESGPFAAYIPEAMTSFEIKHEDWGNGRWTQQIPEILQMECVERNRPNGADEIADYLLALR